jgi:hypothetical protein
MKFNKKTFKIFSKRELVCLGADRYVEKSIEFIKLVLNGRINSVEIPEGSKFHLCVKNITNMHGSYERRDYTPVAVSNTDLIFDESRKLESHETRTYVRFALAKSVDDKIILQLDDDIKFI